jgi:hypothetical protein
MTRVPFQYICAAVTVVVAVSVPSAAAAQSCLGLNAAQSAPTVEFVSNFHRDGVAGPSTIGVGINTGSLFGSIQSAANTAEAQPAFLLNGIGLSAGASMKIRGLDICAGASYSQDESVGFTTTGARGLFGGAALPLPKLLGVPFSLFGVMATESRTSQAAGGDDETVTGLGFRTGIATYPREWIGLRVFQDHAGDGARRVGFSVAFALAVK